MAIIEYWIQIENHAWDASPRNIDRISGRAIQDITEVGSPMPVVKTLTSPETGAVRTRTMFLPLSEDALILRRYTPNWAAPDDRKVNPWDLNELDPTDNGTMGTIPGPVIECSIGDTVMVHFRNKDFRVGKAPLARTHSLHPHGFVFAPTSDGAYPLSPVDPSQPVGPEAPLWAVVGQTTLKKGDRVPPGGTFTYTWNTLGWPTTAGVWLYHDHSVCDMENVQLGAIGIIVIHNPQDPDDVITPDLPGNSPNGSPTRFCGFPFPVAVPTLPHDLEQLGTGLELIEGLEVTRMPEGGHAMAEAAPEPSRRGRRTAEGTPAEHAERPAEEPLPELMVRRGDLLLELDRDLLRVTRLFLRCYRTPPTRAQYLLLFHNLGSAMMCINGRKYLGNTPTVIAGLNTKMRFGVVGMGNFDGFHTFHLHGHRWVIPGPDGNNPGAIQNSSQIKAVSQFEDTRTFGPANSFSFTINQGSFMGSVRAPDAPGLGEWHMHCHVLNHMMDGMMGSLLIVQGGELALGLPRGEHCPADMGTPPPGVFPVGIEAITFVPQNAMISVGQTVRWTNHDGPHTVTSNPGTQSCSPTSLEAFDSGLMNNGAVFDHTFNTPGSFAYHCEVHGCSMSGVVTVM